VITSPGSVMEPAQYYNSSLLFVRKSQKRSKSVEDHNKQTTQILLDQHTLVQTKRLIFSAPIEQIVRAL